MKVFIGVAGLTAQYCDQLRHALAGHEVVFNPPRNGSEPPASLSDSQVIFGNVPPAWLKRAEHLEWLQLDSAGFDGYLSVLADRHPPPRATNLRNFYGEAVAETLLSGLLAFYRQLPALFSAQSQRSWIKDAIEPHIDLLTGKRVIILGAGSIGLRLGELFQAFGCTVDYFARTSPIAKLHSLTQLDAALPSAHVVVNTLPQTKHTQRLLDEQRLDRFSERAVFVNGGRGSVVDESALIARLQSGKLRGAVLDVTLTEPLPKDHPFWSLSNVLLTQHTGGRFPGEIDEKISVFLENFSRFAQGQPLQDLIDPVRGY